MAEDPTSAVAPDQSQPDAPEGSNPQGEALEGGAYEVLRRRLAGMEKTLRDKLNKLNHARKEAFGGTATEVIGSQRIETDNNCLPRDVIGLGEQLIFGYNVFIGLKQTTAVSDVFSFYRHDGSQFVDHTIPAFESEAFTRDFEELYKYYKNARFIQFVKRTGKLLLVFQVGDSVTDRKIFRFSRDTHFNLEYIDDRGDVDYTLPPQHEFEWTETTRDDQVAGEHPHVSIKDKVFVECVGGDLTIKVEDNTADGAGIYSEPVDNPDQTLDDADIQYAEVGELILIRVLPYRENKRRYFVFNTKDQTVIRADSIESACVLLPEDHGVIFPRGYYLQSGVMRQFDRDVSGMYYLDCMKSPNGEDFLYVFHEPVGGIYILLHYNLIEKDIRNPIFANGFGRLQDGKMVFFNNPDDEPRRIHTLQIWQTPFYLDTHQAPVEEETYLHKVGNRSLVRGISDGFGISHLITDKPPSLVVFRDIIRSCTRMHDAYHWLGEEQVFDLKSTLEEIKGTATAAVEEYEKVQRIKRNTAQQLAENEEAVRVLILDSDTQGMRSIDDFVDALDEIRTRRGKVISLRDLRYIDLEKVDAMDNQLEEANERLSHACIDFLLQPEALDPLKERDTELNLKIKKSQKVSELKGYEEDLEELAGRLDLLTDIVNNLDIDDPTKTTQIVDNITEVYGTVNRTRATARNLRQEMGRAEAEAEFAAQFKLLGQSITNYVGMCDSIEKADEFLTKVLVTIEELEGKFADFDTFALQLTEKREEAYNAFSSRKQVLEEEKKRRVGTLVSSAERIISGIKGRADQFKSVDEVNAYFASDLMVSKLRDIVTRLFDADESVRADDISGQLKAARDAIVRGLRDKLELFEGDENIIKLGDYKFTVNTQTLELTTVMRDGEMYFHLTGTDFYELISNDEFRATKPLWDDTLISENREVYRAEYLAYQILRAAEAGEKSLSISRLAEQADEPETLQKTVAAFSANLYTEGYEKGIHDRDAALILEQLIGLYQQCGLLRYNSEARAHAILFWCFYGDRVWKGRIRNKVRSFGSLIDLFEGGNTHPEYVDEIRLRMGPFFDELDMAPDATVLTQAADYLFHELQDQDELEFTINALAQDLTKRFNQFIYRKSADKRLKEDLKSLSGDVKSSISLLFDWVEAYVAAHEDEDAEFLVWEVVAMLAADEVIRHDTRKITTYAKVEGLLGNHNRIKEGKLDIHFDRFLDRLKRFSEERVPAYRSYLKLRSSLANEKRKTMRLDEFKPQVMSGFVRNKLINDVYLNLVGANFAKQMGAAGDTKRTDLMGLLLLISPPGYGKTTLMEYISSRLGLTFMKINGPAIGHRVTSLDPAEAPNATSREELQKLNLSLEMGNNVMIYLDDIQHLDPEFLQKFISLCDAQRKIEGVYKGVTRTYDLRGKKVSVVMAGNPYTESGDKFRIPDMLSNRADTYNLGDISSTAEDAFALSFIENAMTSNGYLSQISSRSHDDIYRFMQIVERGSREGIEFEHNYQSEEINDIVAVLTHMVRIRSVVLRVNREYIDSAAQADAYRTEPAFKLQGSYRNMNRMAEKIVPIMTAKEVDQMTLDNYINESQTLTTGAEANLLKFKEITGQLDPDEAARWEAIKHEFKRRNVLGGDDDNFAKILMQLGDFNRNITGIAETLQAGSERTVTGIEEGVGRSLAGLTAGIHEAVGKLTESRNGREDLAETLKASVGTGLDQLAGHVGQISAALGKLDTGEGMREPLDKIGDQLRFINSRFSEVKNIMQRSMAAPKDGATATGSESPATTQPATTSSQNGAAFIATMERFNKNLHNVYALLYQGREKGFVDDEQMKTIHANLGEFVKQMEGLTRLMTTIFETGIYFHPEIK